MSDNAIFRESELVDESVFRALVDRGVERSLAARIVEFLPIYCRWKLTVTRNSTSTGIPLHVAGS